MTYTASRPRPMMTVDEFFAWDGGGHQGKLELVNGVVRAQMPASSAHGMIQIRLGGLIDAHLRLRSSPCRVGGEVGITPRIDPNHNTRVPDLTVTCKPLTPGEKLFPDPVLIVEILSPSNERDTWESIWACASIPSLKEIAVLESERVGARVFRREANGDWAEEAETVGQGGMLRLVTIEAEFEMEEVYAGTHLAAKT